MTDELCRCGCGKPLGSQPRMGLARSCYTRWLEAGKPEIPPLPRSSDEITALRRQRLEARAGVPLGPDGYDLDWHRRLRDRATSEPVMRMDRMITWACRFSAVVRRRDMHGVGVMLARLTPADKDALLIALAETADPWQLIDIAGDKQRSA